MQEEKNHFCFKTCKKISLIVSLKREKSPQNQ